MDDHFFTFSGNLRAVGDPRLNNATMLELWRGFCGTGGALLLDAGSANTFVTEGMVPPELPPDEEFVIRVTRQGIAVTGRDYGGLARGLMVVMMRITSLSLVPGQERFRVGECLLHSRYTVARRMIHLCVFPETSPLFLRKLIRLAGVMQYTHIVLEYWGMLQYDCLKELAWPQAFSKAFAKEMVEEIENLGMEAIPMMNHLGHASGCRVTGGKHVVLDQNPRLAGLFSQDGWSWNIESPDTWQLLSKIRQELYEIYPHTGYFHLGCDEVYSYERGEEDQRKMRRFLRDIICQVRSEGKRPIIWGDMLLNARNAGVEGDPEPYFCSCDSPEDAEKLIAEIPRDTIIVDWHYDNLTAPVKTSLYLKSKGFDVMGAPWYREANCQAHVDTIRDGELYGLMVTTWHTLAEKLPHILADALMVGAYQSPWSGAQPNKVRTEAAALLRKVCFVRGDYREAGWTEAQAFLQAYIMV